MSDAEANPEGEAGQTKGKEKKKKEENPAEEENEKKEESETDSFSRYGRTRLRRDPILLYLLQDHG